MTLCFTSRKLWRIMLRAAGPIVGRIYRYYIMYETTIKFQFSFLIQKRVLFYSLTQRSLPTSWGTWTSPERIGKRAKIFILKGLELFNGTLNARAALELLIITASVPGQCLALTPFFPFSPCR